MHRVQSKLFGSLICVMISLCGVRDAPYPASVEKADIEAVLQKYIDGTSKGKPDLLREAFHPEFNLYARNADDTLRIWDGNEYISLFESGKPRNRIGRVVYVDQEGDTAVARVEIEIPQDRLFTDYFLLVKYGGQWKIIHKSFTSRPLDD
ncbi:MAG: nuclear transport factor 2 family protein [Pseudomonadota bacterium]